MIDKQYLVDSKVIPLNINVSDDKVLPYMYPVFEELRNTLPVLLYAALDALSQEYVKEWSITNTYVTDDKVTVIETGVLKMFKAAQGNSDSKPTTANTANWTEVQLGTFLVGYVQPYLAHSTFYGYSINSGVNVSHQGLQQISNETAAAVTGNNLQAFLNYWKNQANLKRRSMLNHLDTMSNTLDTVGYLKIEEKKKTTSYQIRGIGKQIDRLPINKDLYYYGGNI